MTSVSTRLIVFSLLTCFLVTAACTSFTGQFIIDLFGNPIKDLKNTFMKQENNPKTSSVREDLYNTKGEGRTGGKMIEVPLNVERPKCENGLHVDMSGVCREPW